VVRQFAGGERDRHLGCRLVAPAARRVSLPALADEGAGDQHHLFTAVERRVQVALQRQHVVDTRGVAVPSAAE
jgi:hypothetical protein